uniref:Uncharacterized protein n=1 Tax=Anguilla anguilla TaxID=7936 RepID=A0A0E9PKV3_ANGAN
MLNQQPHCSCSARNSRRMQRCSDMGVSTGTSATGLRGNKSVGL